MYAYTYHEDLLVVLNFSDIFERQKPPRCVYCCSASRRMDISEQIMKNVYQKHLIVVGKSEVERHQFVQHLIETSSKLVYKFPPGIKSFDEYIEHVRRIFPFIPVNWDEQNPNKWTLNQVWDFHSDWTDNTHSILMVIEEFGKMEEEWKIEILRHYLSTSYYQEEPGKSYPNFQLIVTQDEDDDIIDKIIPSFGLKEDEKRTEKQIIEGKMDLINLELM